MNNRQQKPNGLFTKLGSMDESVAYCWTSNGGGEAGITDFISVIE